MICLETLYQKGLLAFCDLHSSQDVYMTRILNHIEDNKNFPYRYLRCQLQHQYSKLTRTSNKYIVTKYKENAAKLLRSKKKEIILMNSKWDLRQQIWALETQKKIQYDSLRKFYLLCNGFTLGGLRSKEPAGITILRVLKTVNGRSSWTFALDCQVNLRSWETSNDLTAHNNIVFLVWHVPSLAHRLSLS